MAKKRISNRKYPSRECKKLGCTIHFIPTDRRQLYCCTQHRIDHNNDERTIRTTPARALNEIHKSNQQILENLYNRLVVTDKLKTFNGELLAYLGYNWQFSTDRTRNILTNGEIIWSYHFGLEGNPDTKTFKLHERKYLPFL